MVRLSVVSDFEAAAVVSPVGNVERFVANVVAKLGVFVNVSSSAVFSVAKLGVVVRDKFSSSTAKEL